MSSKLQSLHLDFLKIICAETVKFCTSRIFITLTPKRTAHIASCPGGTQRAFTASTEAEASRLSVTCTQCRG